MSVIFHPWAALVARVALGGILVYASVHKITDPPDFAKIIYNYKLFPSQAVNLLAIYVPWVEAFTGLALISGFGRRGASLIAGLLFTSFIVMLSYNLARECPTVCGCFDTYASAQSMTDAEKFARMRREIWIDAGCLALAAYCFIASFNGARSRAT